MKVTTCKSCGAKIVWIKTQNGRSMPCDAEQVEYQKNYRGSALVVTKDGEVVRGNIIKDGGSALVLKRAQLFGPFEFHGFERPDCHVYVS